MKLLRRIKQELDNIYIYRTKGNMRRSLSMLLACIVVFVTVYQMILPALTLELTKAQQTPGIYLEKSDLSEETYSEDIAENSSTSASEVISDLGEAQDEESAYFEEASLFGETEFAESGIDYSMIDDVLRNEEESTDTAAGQAEFFDDSIAQSGLDGEITLDDESGEYTYDGTELTAECGSDIVSLSYDASARIPDGSVLTATRLEGEEAAPLEASAEQAILGSYPDCTLEQTALYKLSITGPEDETIYPAGQIGVMILFGEAIPTDMPIGVSYGIDNIAVLSSIDMIEKEDGGISKVTFACDRFEAVGMAAVATAEAEQGVEIEAGENVESIMNDSTQSDAEIDITAEFVETIEENSAVTEAADEEFGTNFDNEPVSEGTDETSAEETGVVPDGEADGTSEDETDRTSAAETEGTSEAETDGTSEGETDGTPEEGTDETSEDETDGTSEGETDGTPEEGTDETSEDETDGTTEDEIDGTSEEGTDETPEAETDGTPEEGTDETSEAETDETSEKPEAETGEKPEENPSVATGNHSSGTTTPAASGTTSLPAASADFLLDVPGKPYSLHISYDETAGIPVGAEFVATPLEDDDYASQAIDLVTEETESDYANLIGLFDLTIYLDGKVIAPTGPVKIEAVFEHSLENNEEIYAVHFPGTGEQPQPEDAHDAESNISYDAEDTASYETSQDTSLESFGEAYAAEREEIVEESYDETVVAAAGAAFDEGSEIIADPATVEAPDFTDFSAEIDNTRETVTAPDFTDFSAEIDNIRETAAITDFSEPLAEIGNTATPAANDSPAESETDATASTVDAPASTELPVESELNASDSTELPEEPGAPAAPELIPVVIDGNAASFETESFSYFALVGTKNAKAASAEDGQTQSDVVGRYGLTNTANVKVYSGHNLVINTQIDTIETAGTRVTILGMESGSLNLSSWYQITYVKNEETITGYVETKYINIPEMADPVSGENDAFKATASWEKGVLPEGTLLEAGEPSLTEEERKALENQALSVLTASPGKTLKVTGTYFFDLSFMSDGVEIEPNGEVNVSMELKETFPTEENESLHLVHFTGSTGMAELLEKADFTKDASGNLSKIDFTVGNFSTFVVVKTLETTILASNGETYEVTVYYTEDANIPDGSSLSVEEFSEDSEKYEYARRAVLADKKARSEWVDLNSFGLAAMDISILNPEGREIEPEALVYVDIRIKKLPGVENLREVEDTLAIQHHVEVEDGVVVETVFDRNAEASFKLETNETVAGEGIVVDPDSVSEEDFVFPETFTPLPSLDEEQDAVYVSFQTPVFSTFTVSWMKDINSDNATMHLIWRGNGWNPPTYSNITIHYLDMDGEPIQRPLGDQTTTNQQTIVITSGNYINVPGYQFDHAWVFYDQSAGTGWNLDEVSVQFLNYYNTMYTLIQHGGANYKTGSYSNNRAYTNDIYLYFRKTNTETISATIHYVDESGNELTVSNGQPVSDTYDEVVSWYWSEEDQAYTIPAERWYFNCLIYDVEGYEYAYTYRNTDSEENHITPILNYRNDSWKYTSGTETYGPSNSWTTLSDDDDIYVVYKPKAAVTEGGIPQPKITGEKPDSPTITKESAVNHDGTNTLSLSVTGHTSVLEAEKLADVIVVYDVSGSMNYKIDSETEAGEGERRMDLAQEATLSLANSLLSKNTAEHPDLIRMSLISFSNTAERRQDLTTDLTVYSNAVNNLPSPNGGTNWEYALQLANEMAVESDRATFVVFVTDGNPTFRQTRGVLNNGGTGSLGDNDISDYYYLYQVYGTGNSDVHNRNYAAALTQAQSIVNHNKNFYTIGISSDVTNLTNLATEAGAGADHSKTATSEAELVAAFDDIAASIIAHLGHSDVKITDGITDLTQTVQKSTLVSFAEDDFTYYKGHAATAEDVTNGLSAAEGDMVWVSWNPTTEGCAEAVYNSTTGAVEWNMGETFMLEDGYTYQVRFKVWPSQEAYDLLADLNNGIKSYDSLSDTERAQISEPTTAGGMYTLKTNSETGYTYREATKSGDTVTPVGEPSEPGTFPDVDPLELTTKPLKVQKLWHNNYVDSRALTDSITMELYGVDPDGVTSHDFKEITLTKEGNWYAENNYISYGLVTYNTATNAGAKIYETGHDFTLRETDDEAHYYELTAGVYRPMFINGTPTILEKVDAAPGGMADDVFHYADGSHHYYRLDGKIYRDTQSDILLIATNSHRSYMDLNKVVVDQSGAETVDDTEFEYNITFTVPSDIANYDSLEKYIWFSIYDSVAGRILAPAEYTYSGVITPAQEDPKYSGPEYANYLVAISGRQMTLKIKQGWNVRFLNLPIGTTYSFEEINIPEGYNFVKAEVSGTRWIANMVDGKDQGSAQTMSSLPVTIGTGNDNTGISGTIDFANARYKTTYTNKSLPQYVKILKTGQDGTTPLSGAVFSLYTERGYNTNPKSASKTGLTSGTNGMIDLGGLAFGKYYLVETKAPAGYILPSKPIVITVTATQVTYNQDDNALSMSNDGVSYDETTKTYTLTVTNYAGYELPSTGGPGTTLFYLLGSLLLAAAAMLLTLKVYQRRVQA